MNKETPNWLKRTQESSWEPEILISGISLIALFQLPDLIHKAQVFIQDNTFEVFLYGTITNNFFTLMEVAVYWLILCLIMHLGLRSIWVSFVGLSYVFPEGISFKDLKLTNFFKSRLLRIRSFEESVIRLEKISSMMYATAFLLVIATIGISIYFTFWVVLVIGLLSLFPDFMNSPNGGSILSIIMLAIATPYFIDFLTLGWLKRFKWFTKIYRPIYIVSGILTLAPFYRGIYYGLISNIKRRFIFIGLLFFVVVTFFVFSGLLGSSIINRTTMVAPSVGYLVYEGYYRDLNPEIPSRWATIGSSDVDNGVIKLIISHKAAHEEKIKADCDYDARIAKNEEGKSVILLDCVSSYYEIEIDSINVVPERWFFAESPSSNQLGIATWLRTDTISNGIHQLNIYDHKNDSIRTLVTSIPFFNLSGKSFSKSKTIDFHEANEVARQDTVSRINLPLEPDL